MNKQEYDKVPDSYAKGSVRLIKTPSSLAKKTFFYVQETGYNKLIKPHNTSRKELNSFLFVYVHNGKGVLEFEGETYQIGKGQCFYIDCMKKHRYYSSKDEPWEIYWVHFNGATSKEYFDSFYKNEIPVFYPIDPMATERYMVNILEANKDHSYEAEVKSSQIIVSLLTQALTGKNQSSRSISEIAQKSHQYIDNHFIEKLTLEHLECELFVSRFHIEKEFKKAFGVTVFEYVISKRINLAKKLLRFSDESIEEVAIKCGFSNQSYFNRQFKKAEGMTGTAFRKKWRN